MEAFFVPMAGGERLCLFHTADRPPRGAVLYVHPFAEEMNLSRRMAALQARALAADGYAVLQVDLFGCGDSAGEFGDATWAGWIDDVLAAMSWLRARLAAPLWLWGLRAGCLLATQAAAKAEMPCSFLFWQPVLSGETHWRQFLRIRTAAEAIGGGAGEPERSVDDAQPVEVAGYWVAPALSAGLVQARLDLPANSGHVVVAEVVSGAVGELPSISPALDGWVRRAQATRPTIAVEAVEGPAFWQTPEAPDCTALLAATSRLLRGVP